jgi:ATP-dependent Clp protease adapter protein ClpS
MVGGETLGRANVMDLPMSADGAAPRPDGVLPLHCYTSRRFPVLRPKRAREDDDKPDADSLYEVRIIDNDFNTYGEVMDITMLALGIDETEAYAIAWEVDHRGSCVVAHVPRDEAEAIATTIRTIGIEVQVNPVPMPEA